MSLNQSKLIEYEILFTKQIQQKNKTWHDGILKHYLFNNKIQIFDKLSKILIIDEFLKEKGLVSGMVFQTSSCLVEVGEVARVENRDLTGLFRGSLRLSSSIRSNHEVLSSSIRNKNASSNNSINSQSTPLKRRYTNFKAPTIKSEKTLGERLSQIKKPRLRSTRNTSKFKISIPNKQTPKIMKLNGPPRPIKIPEVFLEKIDKVAKKEVFSSDFEDDEISDTEEFENDDSLSSKIKSLISATQTKTNDKIIKNDNNDKIRSLSLKLKNKNITN